MPFSTWLAVVACGTLWVMLGSMIVPTAREHDFLNLYTGATLARDGQFAELHVPAVQLMREHEYVASLRELVPFVRPSFYALLLLPMAWLPFATAFWAWLGLQTAGLFSVWWWGLRQWGGDSLILAAFFLPTALGIAHGQDCVFMLMVVTGVYIFLRRGADFSAGAVLGLGLIKFHLFLLWPLALLLNRRWRVMAGAGVSIAAELLLSLALGGFTGIENYVALLRNKDLSRLSPSPELMINIHSLPIHFGVAGDWFPVVLVVMVAGLVALACWQAPPWRWIAAASVGSLLAAPHVYGYDAALLLIPLLTAIYEPESPKRVRIAATVLLTPLPFFMSLAGSPWAAVSTLALLAFLMTLASLSPQFQPIPSLSEKAAS